MKKPKNEELGWIMRSTTEFTPKQYKKEPITVRIDFEKLYLIDSLSAKYDISRSEFINQCIDYAIANISKINSSSYK